jgi:hypothetical protein
MYIVICVPSFVEIAPGVPAGPPCIISNMGFLYVERNKLRCLSPRTSYTARDVAVSRRS